MRSRFQILHERGQGEVTEGDVTTIVLDQDVARLQVSETETKRFK